MLIYVLKLEDNKYYIGRTNDINFKINCVKSYWTDVYRPIKLLEIYPLTDEYNEQKYIDKYGEENIYGLNIDYTKDMQRLINHLKSLK
jgi:hypothetical protein